MEVRHGFLERPRQALQIVEFKRGDEHTVRRLQTAKRTLTGSTGVHVMVEFRWSLYKARTDPGVTRIASAGFTVPSCKLLDMSWKYKTLSL